MQTSIENFYKILQVDPSAEPEVITAAYHRLARKYHPDTNTSPDAKLKMQAINEAYDTLSNPAKRADYDRNVRSDGTRTAQTNVGSSGGYALNARYRYEYFLKIREKEEMARQQSRDPNLRSGQGGNGGNGGNKAYGHNPYSNNGNNNSSSTAQGTRIWNSSSTGNAGAASNNYGSSHQQQQQTRNESTWRRPPDVDASMRRWEDALDRQRKVQEQQRKTEEEARVRRNKGYASVGIFVVLAAIIIGLVWAMGGSVGPLTVLIAVGIAVGITVPTTFLLSNALNKK